MTCRGACYDHGACVFEDKCQLPTPDKAAWATVGKVGEHAERNDFIQANNDGGGFGKLTNPKDIIGSNKLPLHLVPTTALAEVALAFLEGALKYGTANWRKAGVRASIYRSAGNRHGDKWWEGQDRDPVTKVHHLANRIACDMILLDAILAGKLTDDRPPSIGAPERIDELAENVEHLRKLFGHNTPKHWTITDTEGKGNG